MTEPRFWGKPDDELLHAGDENEYIAEYIDQHYDGHDAENPLFRKLTIQGFTPMTIEPIAEHWHETALENLIEHLDENYGGPDEPHPQTEGMKKAAKTFVEAVIKEYTVWQCEHVGEEVVIDLPAWCKEHKPDGWETIFWMNEETE